MTTIGCIHGHGVGCGCGDCRISRCRRHEVPALREPLDRALISCQIRTGPRMEWTNRTYEVIRASDGQWRISLGEGAPELRCVWEAVVDWLRALRPRDVEILEAL